MEIEIDVCDEEVEFDSRSRPLPRGRRLRLRLWDNNLGLIGTQYITKEMLEEVLKQ